MYKIAYDNNVITEVKQTNKLRNLMFNEDSKPSRLYFISLLIVVHLYNTQHQKHYALINNNPTLAKHL